MIEFDTHINQVKLPQHSSVDLLGLGPWWAMEQPDFFFVNHGEEPIITMVHHQL